MIAWTHLKAIWKKNRIIVTFAVIALTALLACSYRQIVEELLSVKRRTEVRKMLNAHWLEPRRAYRIRGPLPIAQVEEELFGKQEGLPEEEKMRVVTRGLQSIYFGQAWDKFSGDYRDGDEVYFFTSDRCSWARLHGKQGYVAVRKDRIITCLITKMN